jgi:RhtB (resistance to homoserine/threonine) family protein
MLRETNMDAIGITGFGFFCLAVFLLNLTPGPDTAYIIGRSVAQGRGAGLVSALGISFGCVFHMLASALGLSAILAASATAFTVIKIVGGLYLIYLGLKMLLQKTATQTDQNNNAGNVKIANAQSTAGAPGHQSLRKIFWQATLTNVLNPKVVLFFLSFFPQFVTPDAPHRTLAFMVLGMTFIVQSTLWNSATALVAGTLTLRAGRQPHLKRWLERLVGSAFVALGIRLALTKN